VTGGRPTFWIVAGPNGSGKSSLYGNTDIEAFDQNVQRVRLRVSKGGHDVAEAKIRERWSRSLAQLPWFLEQADDAAIFDNSGSRPQLIGKKQHNTVMIDPNAPAALRKVLGLLSEDGRT
jgi:predicted ABC-type ATPase